MLPAVFADLPFDAARKRADDEGRVFLVSVSAKDDAACEEMDRATWTHPAVAARIEQGAVAIRIDLETDAPIARMLAVDAAPAIVAHDRGGYVGHVDGPLTADALLAWFDGISLGKSFKERRAGELAKNPSDTFRRLQLASTLQREGSLDAATAEYVWLWEHMLEHEPKMAPIRHSTFVDSLSRLVRAHPPAREACVALRPASPPSLDAEDTIACADWFSLNRALGDDARSLAWFDDHGDRALAAEWLVPALEAHVEPLLVAAERWSDVARFQKKSDVVRRFLELVGERAKVHAEIAMVSSMAPPGIAASTFAFTRMGADEKLRATAHKLCRALRAAGRDEEAGHIAAAAKSADDSPEMAAALEGRYVAPTPEELLARAGG